VTALAWAFFFGWLITIVVSTLLLVAALRLCTSLNQARFLLEKAEASCSLPVRELIAEYLRRTA
jgi:hypothetical protein